MQPTNPNLNKHDLDVGMITRNCYDGDSEAMRFVLAKGLQTTFRLSHKDDSINSHNPQSETFGPNQEVNSIGYSKVVTMIVGQISDDIRLQASPMSEGDVWIDVCQLNNHYEIIDCIAKRIRVKTDKDCNISIILSC